MQTIELYRYKREDGGVTISPVKPDGEYTIMYRLLADEGKILVNGDKTTACVDADSVEGWEEIDYVEDEEPGEYDHNDGANGTTSDENRATEKDYREALESLGVNFDE